MESDILSPSNLVGRKYLKSQTLEERRHAGRVYTPPHLVDFVLEQVGYTSNHDLENHPILDPACGAGAFLERAVLRLFARSQKLGMNTESPEGYAAFLASIERNLWGIDSDECSQTLACDAVRTTVATLTGRPPPNHFFQHNVVTADFLLGEAVYRLAPISRNTLAFLVGNPPYVSATRIKANYKSQLRLMFEAAVGRLDLYAIFLERALALSPRGARIAFITPDKYLTSYSARRLRSYVLNTSAVRTIALFRSHKVFSDAAIVPCVTVLERGGAKTPVRVVLCGDRPHNGRVVATEERTIHPSTLGVAPWRLLSSDLNKLASKLRSGHCTLKETSLRISAGPATGRDAVFVLPAAQCQDIEPDLMRPAVRGRDINAYRIANSGLHVLLPYTFDRAGIPQLIQLRKYPRAARYLERHQEELVKRHCVRVWQKRWYDLHDSPFADLARQPKILVPDVANSNRFAVDSGVYFPLHSAYYILLRPEIDLDYLVAVLNSSVAKFLIKLEAPVVKDGFNRFRQQFIMSLPIPAASADMRRSVVRIAQRGDEGMLDALVMRMFGLSEREAATIHARLTG